MTFTKNPQERLTLAAYKRKKAFTPMRRSSRGRIRGKRKSGFWTLPHATTLQLQRALARIVASSVPAFSPIMLISAPKVAHPEPTGDYRDGADAGRG